MALEKSFALSAQYLGRLDICGGNIRAFHILSVGGVCTYLVGGRWSGGLSTGRLLTILLCANTHLLQHFSTFPRHLLAPLLNTCIVNTFSTQPLTKQY